MEILNGGEKFFVSYRYLHREKITLYSEFYYDDGRYDKRAPTAVVCRQSFSTYQTDIHEVIKNFLACSSYTLFYL